MTLSNPAVAIAAALALMGIAFLTITLLALYARQQDASVQEDLEPIDGPEGNMIFYV